MNASAFGHSVSLPTYWCQPVHLFQVVEELHLERLAEMTYVLKIP